MTDPARHVLAFGGHDVLFVMATSQEYGEHLKARIDPLITGVGPVEAAVETARALAILHHQGRHPDLVVTLGSAGSRRLDHAEVYQVARVAYRDMDASALGFERGKTPFLDEPVVVELPHRIAGVPEASLSTGGAIISGAAYDAIAEDMVDMETFAVLRAARRHGVPLLGLRGISDGKAELTGYADWTEYLHIIDEKLARALDQFARQLTAEGLAPAAKQA
ncbi:5'-methylthioadenosine/S-adenosylhomocysteine nucleosidase [Xanthobacter aminoxidans]|jgi:adenosylhomocysteine nucleosidase|uniref:5'-methylthioadenosine/S-adenosylhomocysteine nucleosidase n=1 Tax=Xanthobacter aminoxidans TaxID=186280 RepID=UPI002022B781|nr:5'-methylthioadenosine/S-adenosylhomocysteine nucleosidase [Xanthobacter aminoxidans]MCL8384314.1 5'-methylthioadenosine/S-adenosylhomocysteine nucleosidase [Xanthobacter aminoxidans]